MKKLLLLALLLPATGQAAILGEYTDANGEYIVLTDENRHCKEYADRVFDVYLYTSTGESHIGCFDLKKTGDGFDASSYSIAIQWLSGEYVFSVYPAVLFVSDE